jgi:hypothetical protein
MNTQLLELPAIGPVDSLLRSWTESRGGREQHWPVLMEESTLQRAGYPEAFPHLLMTACIATDPESLPGALSPSGWCLSPAVCYHAYAALEGSIIHGGLRLTARGHCFRNEDADELAPGRRQIEFQMRELVLIGGKDWIEHELAGVQEDISALASDLGMPGAWEIASDPFFLPQAKGKAHMQRLKETKREYCLRDGLAIASINRHETFFGERFHLSLSDGQAASSACIAFGLDRWAAHANHPYEP